MTDNASLSPSELVSPPSDLKPVVVIVGSTNPVKLQATLNGFFAMFPDRIFSLQGVEVLSGVSEQPIGDEETLRGAHQRALNARQSVPDAEYAVGIEGGVAYMGDGSDEAALMAFAWVVVIHRTGKIGRAKSGTFFLPREISDLVKQGMELGHADDRVFGQQDSKRRNGSIGLLTGDAITRTSYYAPAVVMALIPFKNPAFSF